jgi:hypothetical protein
MTDQINSPSHYTQGDIECIDAMVAAYGLEEVQIYAKIAAFKYLWRRGRKDAEQQDVAKAIWYLRFSAGDDPRQLKNTPPSTVSDSVPTLGEHNGNTKVYY